MTTFGWLPQSRSRVRVPGRMPGVAHPSPLERSYSSQHSSSTLTSSPFLTSLIESINNESSFFLASTYWRFCFRYVVWHWCGREDTAFVGFGENTRSLSSCGFPKARSTFTVHSGRLIYRIFNAMKSKFGLLRRRVHDAGRGWFCSSLWLVFIMPCVSRCCELASNLPLSLFL